MLFSHIIIARNCYVNTFYHDYANIAVLLTTRQGLAMTINERLKNLRKEQGLTQTELSKHLKIGQTTIAAYENGMHDPQIFSLLAYAEYFGCSVDYLLGRENESGNTYVAVNQPLTENEKQLLNIYRFLTDELRSLLIEQAKVIKNSKLNSK